MPFLWRQYVSVDALVVDVLGGWAYSQLHGSMNSVLPYYLTMTHSWMYLYIGDNSLIYQVPGSMATLTWSISVEWFFYIVYPFFCFALANMQRKRTLLIIGLLIVSIGCAVRVGIHMSVPAINAFAVSMFGEKTALTDIGSTQDSFFRWLIYFCPYVRVFEFLTGCVCADIFMRMANKPVTRREKINGRIASFLSLFSIIALLCFIYVCPTGMLHNIAPYAGLGVSAGFAPLIAIFIFCIARYESILSRALSTKYILLGGEVSYSIYLLHFPIIMAFRWEALEGTSTRALVRNIIRLGFTVGSIIGLSIISWALIEVPARRWLRNFLMEPFFWISKQGLQPSSERSQSVEQPQPE